MNKKIVLSVVVVVAAVTACVGYSWDNRPDYLRSAEARVGSYLTSDYGRVACASTRVDDLRWKLECQSQTKGKTFQFAVLPADQAPYKVSRPFYLEALSDDAKESASEGLMQYLQINTDVNITTQS